MRPNSLLENQKRTSLVFSDYAIQEVEKILDQNQMIYKTDHAFNKEESKSEKTNYELKYCQNSNTIFQETTQTKSFDEWVKIEDFNLDIFQNKNLLFFEINKISFE